MKLLAEQRNSWLCEAVERVRDRLLNKDGEHVGSLDKDLGRKSETDRALDQRTERWRLQGRTGHRTSADGGCTRRTFSDKRDDDYHYYWLVEK